MTTNFQHDMTVVNTIRKQIGVGTLMGLGATGLAVTRGGKGLTFTARIAKPGQTRPRKCQVEIVYTSADLYDVTICFTEGKAKNFETNYIENCQSLYAEQMFSLLRKYA